MTEERAREYLTNKTIPVAGDNAEMRDAVKTAVRSFVKQSESMKEEVVGIFKEYFPNFRV